MRRISPCNFHLIEIISDAVEAGYLDVGSKEHRVALLVARHGLNSLDDEDRSLFERVTLTALMKPSLEHPNQD